MAAITLFDIVTGRGTLILVSVVTCFSVWLTITRWRKHRNVSLPPGPPSWPVVGNLPHLLKTPGFPNDNYFFNTLAQKYGKIYKLQIGSQLLFVLSDTDLVRAACTDSNLQDRPVNAAYRKVFGKKANGLVFPSGKPWKDARQFTMALFRALGVGGSSFEYKVNEEVNRLIEHLDTIAGKPITSLPTHFYNAVSNIICGLAFGKQYTYDDPCFLDIVDIIDTFFVAMGPSGLALTSPLLCTLPFGPGKRIVTCMNRFKKFLEKIISESVDNLHSDQTPSNFVEAFLLQMEENGNDPNSFSVENLMACSVDIFFAGSDTTSATLSYAILFLATHPNVQDKCQKELDEVLGDGKRPSYQDKAMLPYLQAVLLEVQRLGRIAPLAGPHVAHTDTELQGFYVPNGTIVLPNLTGIMMNKEIFKRPEEFNPDRFMKDDSFESHPDVIPFAVGMRACPGDKIARIIVFTFLSRLLRQYSFVLPDGSSKPDILGTGKLGNTRSPVPYSVIIVKRHT